MVKQKQSTKKGNITVKIIKNKKKENKGRRYKEKGIKKQVMKQTEKTAVQR